MFEIEFLSNKTNKHYPPRINQLIFHRKYFLKNSGGIYKFIYHCSKQRILCVGRGFYFKYSKSTLLSNQHFYKALVLSLSNNMSSLKVFTKFVQRSSILKIYIKNFEKVKIIEKYLRLNK